MDHRQVLFRFLWVTTEHERIVPITYLAKTAITTPRVGADGRSWRYIVLYEGCERISIAPRKRRWPSNAEPKPSSISKFLERDTAFIGLSPLSTAGLSIFARPDFNGAHDCSLMMDTPSFAARVAAYVAFIYLDWMWGADSVSVWPYHAGAELVKHCKRRLVSGDPKLALKLNGRLTGRLRRHKIGSPKPSRERHMARLHDRPGGQGRILLTGPAAQHYRRAGCETVRLADMPAFLAREAVRPAHLLQITGASTIIREHALKLGKARWEGCIHCLRR